MKHLIAISGKRLSGKDTMAKELVANEYEVVKFATPIYDELLALGFTKEDIAEDKEILRPIMLAIGDARRHYDPDHYAKLTIAELEDRNPEFAVISDLRFENEARMLREWESLTGVTVTLVRVARPDLERNLPADRHKSECDLDRWDDWDLIVNANTGELDQLADAALAAMGFSITGPDARF